MDLYEYQGKQFFASYGIPVSPGEAVTTVVAWIMTGDSFSIFSMIAMLVGCIVCILALVRQGDTNLSSSVRTMAKVAMGYYFLKMVVGFVFMMIFSVRNPGTPVVTGLEVVGEPGFSEAALATAGVGAVVGLIGFITLLSHFRRPPAPAA